MQFGAVFPQTEIGNDPGAVRAFAQAVEAMGYTYITVYDHVLGAGRSTRPDWGTRYASEDAFHEVFVLYGFIAGVTTTLGLAIGVLILPQRQTVLVAKQAAALDVLSGGRLRLGIGVGWNPVEFQALGEDFHTRGARTDEQIEVLQALWTRPLVDFEGRWHRIDNAGLNPLPVQRPIPLWFGGTSENMLRRIGRVGAGWMPIEDPDDATRERIARIRTYAAQAGRDPASLGVDAHLTLSDVPEERWSEYADAWRDLGATHLSVQTMDLGYTSVGQHLDALRRAVGRLG